jgi:hypothetical protein
MGEVGFHFVAVAVGMTSSRAAPAMERNPIKSRCSLLRAIFLSCRSSYSDFFQSWITLIGWALSILKATITLMQRPDWSTAMRGGVNSKEAGGIPAKANAKQVVANAMAG